MLAGLDLVHSCIVQIKGRNGVCGTGFYVSPHFVLTCQHVIDAAGEPLAVIDRLGEAEVAVVKRDAGGEDVALLRVPRDSTFWLPVTDDVRPFDEVYTFGYPQDYLRGDAGVAEVAGVTGLPRLLNLVRGQIRPGMSGSPLISRRTGVVCGMVKSTRDERNDIGGRALPGDALIRMIARHSPQPAPFPPNWHQAVEALSAALATDEAKYLLAHVRRLHSARWADRAIDIEASDTNGESRSARAILRDWAMIGRTSALLLTGDFGSGKTWLAIGLAADLARARLAEAAAPAPVFVPIRLHIDALRASSFAPTPISDPPLPDTMSETAQLWILDGVDELLSPSCSDLTQPEEMFAAILRRIPTSARILCTCRRSQLTWASTALSRLLAQRSAPTVLDPTEDAISLLLRAQDGPPQVVEVESVKLEQAERYLGARQHGEWARWCKRPQVQRLLKQPFLLRLIEEVVPLLEERGDLDVDILYDRALRMWLLRAGGRSQDEVGHVLDVLGLNVSAGAAPLSSQLIGALVQAGFLIRTDSGYGFYHHSIGDYLVARHVDNESRAYSASCLATLNLIGSYDINRFLVPMARRHWILKPNQSMARKCATISRDEYAAFLAASKWRHGINWGIHPSFSARDGTRHASDSLLPLLVPDNCDDPTADDSGGPVAAISWYDAAIFARHCGTRLPSGSELKAHAGELQEGWCYWAADWYEESKAHIAVGWSHNGTFQLGGANPDFRHGRLTFGTVHRD